MVSEMGGHLEGAHGEEADGDAWAWALILNEDKLHKYKLSSH